VGHVTFTRMNIGRTILENQIEEGLEAGPSTRPSQLRKLRACETFRTTSLYCRPRSA